MKIAQPTPELPVPDVKQAQAYYRDKFGFEIAWYNEPGNIGAVNHGDCALFLRKSEEPSPGATFWIFTQDVDEAHAEFEALGANITEPIADKPWGMRQFTVQDRFGNTFHFHHDL